METLFLRFTKSIRKRNKWRQSVKQLVDSLHLELLPIARTLRNYSRADFACDLRAGSNGALLSFPQGMAYAMLAGLPIQYGVYSSAVAATISPFFSSSRYNVTGPTNATAVMLLSALLTLPPDIPRLTAISLLVLMVGVILVISAYLQLASLLKFVSRSVIIGYLTAAALLIIINQAHHVAGTKTEAASNLFQIVQGTLASLPHFNPAALLLATLTLGILFLLHKKLPRLPGVAATLVIASMGGWIIDLLGWPVALVDPLPTGCWALALPVFHSDWVLALFGPAAAIAFLAAMESTMMAKMLASRSGDSINPNQELFGLGLANLGCAVGGGMPASGSLTRSALNYQSGARTGLSSVFNGLFCALGALTLGPLTAYIPKAALAAAVIWVAIWIIDPRRLRVAWHSSRSDAIVLLTTFVFSLLAPLDVAIFVGVGLSIALYLHKASSPTLVEYEFNEDGILAEAGETSGRAHISIIHVEGELFFGAADLFRAEIQQVCLDPNLKVIILRMRNARHLDATSAMALEELAVLLRQTGRHLLVSGANKQIYRVLKNTRILEMIDRKNFFLGSARNPNAATRNALKRAQELIGPEKPRVQIFFDPSSDSMPNG